MNIPDVVNGAFALTGGILCWANVRSLLIDKEIKGIYWPVQAFFSVWGWWHLYFYATLSQWVSFSGEVFLVVGNSVWVILAIKFSRRDSCDRD